MKAFEIARVSLLRTVRDRMGLFFIVVLPMILVMVLGLTYGGMSTARIGVADQDGSTLSKALVDGLQTRDLPTELRRYGSAADLQDAVERGFVEVGLAVPAGYANELMAGSQAQVEVLAQAKSFDTAVRTAVEEAVVRQVSVVQAARLAAASTGATFDAAYATAADRAASLPGIEVALDQVGAVAGNPSGFAQGAQSQVILFMFLTSLTGSAVLVSTRQLGVSRRELSTPTSVRTIVAGETLGRFAVALFQGGFIIVATAVLFGVDWIDPLATGAIVGAFALVAAGAAMLAATVVRNEHQVGAVGPAVGMIFGLLGGTMVPIEVFPSVMRTLSNVTPHAWAMDAFHRLLMNGSGVVQILPDLAVLLAFAAVLLSLAIFRFQRQVAAGAA